MRTLVRVLDYSPCLHRIASPFAGGVVRRPAPVKRHRGCRYWCDCHNVLECQSGALRRCERHTTTCRSLNFYSLRILLSSPASSTAPTHARSRYRRAACKCGSLSASWPQHRRRRSRQNCVRDWRLSTPRSQQLSCLTRSSPRVLAWSAAGLLQVPLPRTQPHSWRLRRALKRPLRRYENCQRPLAVARLASDYYDPRFRVLSATVPSSRHLQQGHR